MRARAAELARSWRRTTPMRVSGDPADAESGETGDGAWRLGLRRRRLPSGYLAGVLGGVAALIAGPYAEELWRCAKTSKG
jgi:hypothetical protein